MGEIVQLDATAKRAASVRSYLQSKGPMLKIQTVGSAMDYGDQWRHYAYRVEALLAITTAQRDASDLLLEIAYAELERLRGLIE